MSDIDLLVTRLTTAGVNRAYKLGAVPAAPVAPYCVLTLDTGTASTYSLDSSSDSTRRLSVQIFSKTDEAMRDMATKADAAFRDVALTEFDDDPISNRELNTQIVRDPDAGGLLYCLHVYRYGES